MTFSLRLSRARTEVVAMRQGDPYRPIPPYPGQREANCASPPGPPGRGRLRRSLGAHPGTLMAQLALQYSALNHCTTREAQQCHLNIQYDDDDLAVN